MGLKFFPKKPFIKESSTLELFPIWNYTPCVFCPQLIHDAIMFQHFLHCQERKKSCDLNLNQKKAEICLYVLKFVPVIKCPLKEKSYFISKGIDFLLDQELSDFTTELYKVIYHFKVNDWYYMSAENILSFDDYLLDFFYNNYFQLSCEPVQMISEMYASVTNLLNDSGWINIQRKWKWLLTAHEETDGDY